MLDFFHHFFVGQTSLSTLVVAAVCLVLLVIFAYYIGQLSGRGVRKLGLPAGVVCLLGTILFCFGYQDPEHPVNFITLLGRSFISSLEMFVSETHLDEIAIERHDFLTQPAGHWYLTLFFVVYAAALIVSFWAVFGILGSGLKGRLWASFHRSAASRRQFVFWGINRRSILVAKDLARTVGQEDLIFIDLPGKRDWHRFHLESLLTSDLAKESGRGEVYRELGKRTKVFSSRRPFSDRGLSSLTEALSSAGLSWLRTWLSSPETELFILSSDEDRNLSDLQLLASDGSLRCKVFCVGRTGGLAEKCMSAMPGGNVHFVNDSLLSAQELMRDRDGLFHPVNFIDVATDRQNRSLGYAKSAFHSLILGFGETGQEVLRFLYEFGAFVGKDKRISDSRIYAIDQRMSDLGGMFMHRCPGASYSSADNENGRIVLEEMNVESASFFRFLSEHIHDLNYVVVSLGSTRLNERIGLAVLEYALRNRRNALRHFAVLIHRCGRESVDRLELDLLSVHASEKNYGSHVFTFGTAERIWRYGIVSDGEIDEAARRYYDAYQLASGIVPDPASWALRHAQLERAVAEGDLAQAESVRIKEKQDRHNCYHALTKRRLGGPALCPLWPHVTAECVAPSFGHYDDPDDRYGRDAFEYLAIGEHLRWVCSYEMSGYVGSRDGGKRDYLKKEHECMVPYESLSEEIRHYDWIAVKTAFALLQD